MDPDLEKTVVSVAYGMAIAMNILLAVFMAVKGVWWFALPVGLVAALSVYAAIRRWRAQ